MQNIVSGRGSLDGERLTGLMAQLQMRRPLLVCSARMQADFSARTGMMLPCFSGYHANPDLADAITGVEMYRQHGCDGLISVGGGSAMDTAKAVKALLLAPDMEAVKASRLPEDGVLPHIAIPATAGTGAEATPIAVMYVQGEKLSLDHPALLPEAILLDSTLLNTLPPYHQKACAMDALCQGIESYWAIRTTEESRVHARRAIRGVLAHYDAYLSGQPDAADAMLLAAYESGCAIRISRTTAAHAMSYQITKRIGPAHGHACMLTLPHLWRQMGDAPVLAELSDVMGVSPADAPELLLGLLAASEMLPEELPDASTLDALVASVNVQRLSNHPQKLSQMEMREIYTRALTPVSADERARLVSLWRAYAGEADCRG
ncbi:MAG: iron-containing alcohol dehydrogenase [Clostridiales bacterium]|nr:iron-containing alcohol dehydrogenase [Clostridiales bacterium]